jgi:hypothetical protein
VDSGVDSSGGGTMAGSGRLREATLAAVSCMAREATRALRAEASCVAVQAMAPAGDLHSWQG